MADSGFGSVSYTPAPDTYDVGFGSPDSLVRVAGFGSSFDVALTAADIVGGAALIGDDGGERLDIAGQWHTLAPEPVPAHSSAFTVHFINVLTSDVTPALSGYLGGQGGQVFTNVTQTVIHAYAPPLARGVYSVRVTHSGGVLLISNAFTVITRNRAAEVYSLRKALPAFYKRGAVTAVNETLDALPTYTNLEALTRSIGQVVQRFSGRAFTLSTQQWNEGDTALHVESTLDFDSAGGVQVDSVRFTYTGKTESTFTGVNPVNGQAPASLNTHSKVVRYDKPR
jgi:hypothetical protein